MRALLFLLLTLSACKKHLDDGAPPPTFTEPAPETPRPVPTPTPAVQAILANFERVQFSFDSAEITASGQAALRENATLLTAHPDVVVEIQGHCDERGSTDYNLALGQKRAQAVKRVLTASGAAASRLSVLSYGEERPLDAGDGEIAWAQNRRAEFRVTQGGDGQVEGTVR
jgi:peptidoglycan-associated lipoprotein